MNLPTHPEVRAFLAGFKPAILLHNAEEVRYLSLLRDYPCVAKKNLFFQNEELRQDYLDSLKIFKDQRKALGIALGYPPLAVESLELGNHHMHCWVDYYGIRFSCLRTDVMSCVTWMLSHRPVPLDFEGRILIEDSFTDEQRKPRVIDYAALTEEWLTPKHPTRSKIEAFEAFAPAVHVIDPHFGEKTWWKPYFVASKTPREHIVFHNREAREAFKETMNQAGAYAKPRVLNDALGHPPTLIRRWRKDLMRKHIVRINYYGMEFSCHKDAIEDCIDWCKENHPIPEGLDGIAIWSPQTNRYTWAEDWPLEYGYHSN